MIIERITVWQLDLPLGKPYWLSGGRLRFDSLDSTILRIETDAGVIGWGEGCPWGATYLPGFGKGARAGIAEIAPWLLGRSPCRIDVVNRVMDAALPGHPYAKSAIDYACWDILGKVAGLPVCDLLGGRTEEPLTLHSSISTGTPEEMVGLVEAARARGYRIHSCKVGGSETDADIARIRALMDELRPGDSLTFDANRAWLPDEAIQVMNACADLGGIFEQPCETFEECLRVRRVTRQPLVLDECLHSYQDVVRAHAEGVCDIVNIKVGRVGGLTKARRIRDFCVAMGFKMIIEDTGGSVLADTAAVHLAQSTPATHRRATWLCHDMIAKDTAPDQGARNDGGTTRAPDLPGIGVAPEQDLLGDPVAVYD